MNNDSEKREIVNNQNGLFSNVIRAGRRTYFFDVKTTKNNDYYLTITESKKVYDEAGNASFEKHKVFLYKEDFEKFCCGLNNSIEFIRDAKKEDTSDNVNIKEENQSPDFSDDLNAKVFSNIEFEDLAN